MQEHLQNLFILVNGLFSSHFVNAISWALTSDNPGSESVKPQNSLTNNALASSSRHIQNSAVTATGTHVLLPSIPAGDQFLNPTNCHYNEGSESRMGGLQLGNDGSDLTRTTLKARQRRKRGMFVGNAFERADWCGVIVPSDQLLTVLLSQHLKLISAQNMTAWLSWLLLLSEKMPCWSMIII